MAAGKEYIRVGLGEPHGAPGVRTPRRLVYEPWLRWLGLRVPVGMGGRCKPRISWAAITYVFRWGSKRPRLHVWCRVGQMVSSAKTLTLPIPVSLMRL